MSSAPLIAVCAQIIKGFGDKGCTSSEVMAEVKKGFPQWKPESASPQISYLVWLGAVRREGDRYHYRLFHVRDLEKKDLKRLRKRDQKSRAARATEPEAEAIGPSVYVDPKIVIETEAGPITLTFLQARQLYRTLEKVFGKKIAEPE